MPHPHHATPRIVLLATALLLATACDSKPAADAPAVAASPEEVTADAADAPAAAKPPVMEEPPAVKDEAPAPVIADDAKPDSEAPRALFEQAPVYESIFDPKELPSPPRGTLEFGISWTDFVRENHLVATITESKGKTVNGEATKSGLIRVEHWIKDGDLDGEWKMLEDYEERVNDCAFDLTLAVKRGEWSLSNLDDDGYAEATFAWSAGCRSDVSPITHKVLMIEDGKKYVLRGQTREWPSRTDPVGGEFKADAAFAKAPEGFLKHAERAWEATRDL